MLDTPKSTSVLESGEPDGWDVEPGWHGELTHAGETRIIVSVPTGDLARVHLALVRAMSPKLGVLYRQLVDRRDPRPNGAPPRDLVALELRPDHVVEALSGHAGVVYHDARCELWVRGGMGEQVVLDGDGLIYCYPDDPSFRDVLEAEGLPESDVQTLVDRDYVKHWYHAEHDADEDGLVQALGLREVPTR